MRLSLLVLLTLAAVLSISAQVHAQRRTPQPLPQTAPQPQPEPSSRDEEARMLFEAGRVAYAAGRFEDALGYFERTHEMSGRTVLLYNVGSAADKLRRDSVALTAFRSYLEAVPAADNREEVEARIRVLEQVVAADQARATPNITPPPADPTVEAAAERTRERELNASLAGRGQEDDRDDGSVFSKWWFWTIVGVVVVGATIGAIAAASSSGGLGPFQTGDDGSVHMTLGMP